MKSVLLIPILSSFVFGAYVPKRGPIKVLENGIGGKILGGSDAEKGEFPFQISWQSITGMNSCGGSVLNENWILTAGHCCKGVDFSFQIVAGEYNTEVIDGTEQRRDLLQRVLHEDYDPYTIDNDVCVVQVDAPFELNDNVRPVDLDDNGVWEEGDEFIVSGWGVTSTPGGYLSDVLQKVIVPFVSDNTCKNSYEAEGYDITEGMICAGGVSGHDACQGDSGGPLTTKSGLQVGVVSWGIGCGIPEFPGVYAKVAHFRDWILRHAQ